MAYTQENFDIIKQNHDGTSFCFYREVGTALATLVASGYFDSMQAMLGSGSVIIVIGSDSQGVYRVTNTAGVITLAAIEGPGQTSTITEIDRVCDVSARLVGAGGTLSATVAGHDGKTILLDTAAGSVVTLPAAAGTGAIMKFLVSVTATSNSHIIKVNDATDLIHGFISVLDLDAASDTSYKANGTTFDTITMNRTTTGGVIGDYVELQDIAANTWVVTRGRLTCVAGSNPATPFSATVA